MSASVDYELILSSAEGKQRREAKGRTFIVTPDGVAVLDKAKRQVLSRSNPAQPTHPIELTPAQKRALEEHIRNAPPMQNPPRSELLETEVMTRSIQGRQCKGQRWTFRTPAWGDQEEETSTYEEWREVGTHALCRKVQSRKNGDWIETLDFVEVPFEIEDAMFEIPKDYKMLERR